MHSAHGSVSYQPLMMPPSPPSPPHTMPTWLSRSPTHHISKSPKTIDVVAGRGTGALGSGATVVRTPDDALRDTGVRVNYAVQKQTKSKHKRSASKPSLMSPPTSPPLPPLPLPADDEETPRPSRSLPDLHRSSRRSSLKLPKSIAASHSNSSSDDPPSLPPLPPHIAASTQPPPFSPILVSEPSSMIVNRNKVIVTLETCTHTYRTALTTLTSRPSHLAKYLSSLYCLPTSSSAISSVYSTESDDMALYRQHLTSQGLVPLSSNVHLFLDRPSAPYAYILAYLRQPVIDGRPDTLPYALQLHNYTSPSPFVNLQSRLDTLIEVRDEAAYLKLQGLQRLCADEIKHRYGPRQHFHQRGNSSSSIPSIHSMQASVYCLQTLPESVETDRNTVAAFISPVEVDMPVSPLPMPSGAPIPISSQEAGAPSAPGPVAPSPAAIAIRRSKHAPLGENTFSRSPPTPQSMEGTASEQSHTSSHSRSSSRSRPGWI